MKPRNLYRIIIGALMVISGIVSIVLTPGEAGIGTMLLAAGIVFLITGIVHHRKYRDDPESDVRSKKIGAYGLSYAWLTGLFFMYGLFWLDYLGALKLKCTECTHGIHACPCTLSGDLPYLSLPERGCRVMMKIIRNNLIIGSIAITLGIILLVLIVDDWIPENIILISGSMIAAGILFVLFSVLQLRGVIEIPDVSDERILKIRAHTFMKAYMFSFTIVCIFSILNLSGIFIMNSQEVIMTLVSTMGLSAFLLSMYYTRQGDICEE